MSKVEDKKVVFIHYTLTNDEGEVLDKSEGDDPLFYLHGYDNIVPGLERELTGMEVGDKKKVTVAPEDGYGEIAGPGEQEFGLDAFPPDVNLEPGMDFHAQLEDGAFITFWVTRVTDTAVFMDTNHPLAGSTLHFDVEVTRIRDAVPVEIDHGHPHGPEGDVAHHH